MSAPLILFAAATASASTAGPDLVELATIVEPYARCEISHEPQYKKTQEAWSAAVRKKYANPTDRLAATEADRLMEQMRAANLQIQAECGYEDTHQRLRDRLMALHPKMDSSRAFWLARGVFATLNNLNETVVKFGAGIFPPSPPAPIGAALRNPASTEKRGAQ